MAFARSQAARLDPGAWAEKLRELVRRVRDALSVVTGLDGLSGAIREVNEGHEDLGRLLEEVVSLLDIAEEIARAGHLLGVHAAEGDACLSHSRGPLEGAALDGDLGEREVGARATGSEGGHRVLLKRRDGGLVFADDAIDEAAAERVVRRVCGAGLLPSAKACRRSRVASARLT
ncbi:MAG: hypothetical protein R3B70_42870 [Polyangiaceae bacterium]